jgi:hypothetical protein
MGKMRLKRPTVQGFSKTIIGASWAALCLFGAGALAEEYVPTTSVVISVAEQKLAILKDGGLIKKYPISTSKFGLGDSFGSYKTPLGRLRVCQKIGDDLTAGAVLKQRHATGEVLPVNAPGRDPIVTRIIWLDGLEPQNQHARSRGIYIHGTVEESKIGEPVSYGCIRMRSKDVVEVFEEVPLDTAVTIMVEKFPRYAKYTPPKPAKQTVIAATNPPAKGEAEAVAKAPAVVAHVPAHQEKSTKVEATNNPMASLALKGSILDAGLPEGPKIPTLPAPPEPKDVPRFGTFTPNQTSGSAFSLQGIARDLSPVIRAADMDATARETAAREAAAKNQPKPAPEAAETKPAETTEPAPKPRVAFRSGTSTTKPKR